MNHRDTKTQRKTALRMVLCGLSLCLCVSVVNTAFAQSAGPKIWTGVYSAAQAERGKTNFTGSCARCHLADLSGGTGPSLKGERFITAWQDESLYRLFTKIRDTMPPNFGTTLTEEAKLDVITYILQSNGFPAGSAELTLDQDNLESVQVVRKGTGTTLPNFSLVQVVGCLAPGPNDAWLLTNTSEPIVTKDQPSTPDELRLAESRAPGKETFRLVSTSKFKSAFQPGQKIEAKGLLYREPNDSRLNLTSLKTLGSTCAK
jgi:mono/diheme cytochrome c family protein